MSVVNMMVRPVGGTQSLLKSKERVIFHVGCRRFAASPVYSEHTNGDKYKVRERHINTSFKKKVMTTVNNKLVLTCLFVLAYC